jgi:hypothetical protein
MLGFYPIGGAPVSGLETLAAATFHGCMQVTAADASFAVAAVQSEASFTVTAETACQ